MSLSASLNAGVQGLAVNSTRLSAISDNIVNANTNGYKRTIAEFADVVIDGGNNSTYTAGGVKSYIKRDINAIGTLASTTSATDIAVSGQGFIPVSPTADPSNFNISTNPVYLTTTGSFEEDAEGFLKNSADNYLLGWPLNPDGTTVNPQVARNSFANLEPVNARVVRFNSVETTEMKLSGPIPANATNPGADPALQILHNEEYYDTIGNTNSLQFSFTPVIGTTGPSNTWTMNIYDSATTTNGGLIGSFSVVFNGATDPNSGTIQSITPIDTDADGTPDAPATYNATTGELTLGTASTDITTFIGIPGTNTGFTQTGSLDKANIRLDHKDGSGFGEYKGVRIDNNGIVWAYFTNDQSRPIFQLPVISVANPNAMEPVGDQSYIVTPEAGTVTLSDAGDRQAGKISGYALMQSSVDVAKELTNLIETQRAYSSNAKIIQTVDEMFQETTNLKR